MSIFYFSRFRKYLEVKISGIDAESSQLSSVYAKKSKKVFSQEIFFKTSFLKKYKYIFFNIFFPKSKKNDFTNFANFFKVEVSRFAIGNIISDFQIIRFPYFRKKLEFRISAFHGICDS